MKRLDLDALLGDVYAEATFHDSELLALSVHFERGTAELMFRVPTGAVDHDLVYRAGTLIFTDLLFLAMDPPGSPLVESRASALWITSDGPLPDGRVKTSIRLPADLPDDGFCHYLFGSNSNSFIVMAAKGATFEWSSPEDG